MSDINDALLDGINRIEDKCDKINDRVADLEKAQAVAHERAKRHTEHMEKTADEVREIKKILSGQHEQLTDHVARSNALQSQQDQFIETLQQINNRIVPLEEQKNMSEIIEEYDKRKKEKIVSQLKDWKTIMAFILTTVGFITAVVGYIKGWFN